MKSKRKASYRSAVLVTLFCLVIAAAQSWSQSSYPVVDTGQDECYNNSNQMSFPSAGQAFYGQDAQHNGNQPFYRDNGDGTITDLVTGLMWTKYLPSEKYTYTEAIAYAEQASIAGHTDWRLPTIKEQYSLIDFRGVTGMSEQNSVPYIDTDYFDFRYGGAVNPSERFIDSQFATTTVYKGRVMNNQEALFGVNFADGRIKGYPLTKDFEVMLVRGNFSYGKNDFVDNNDGTITDKATNLMWDKAGSSTGLNWQEALAYAQDKNTTSYLGHTDWRLPNAKELHSILDYDRSPSETNSAAIDAMFDVPSITVEGGLTDYPFYWTSTSHKDGPDVKKAVYLCFGKSYGFMEQPPNSGNFNLLDVHGAGAQRSDPKSGNPDDYPNGHGPQGDVIRIYNYVRLVRDASAPTGMNNGTGSQPMEFGLANVYPNPVSAYATVSFTLPEQSHVSLTVYNALGKKVATLIDSQLDAGSHSSVWDPGTLPGGIYFGIVTAGQQSSYARIVLSR
jgi:uncharacterized protein DUF1566/type IX secretion system substrate protein